MTTYAPRHVDIWPFTKWKATTYTPTRTVNSAYFGMGYLYLDAASATGCYVTYDVALDAGTWTLSVVHTKNSGSGIVTPSIGGTDLSTLDLYSAAGAANAVGQWTGITVATAGVYEVKFRTDTKHASASDYDLVLQLVTLTRTGA